MARILLLTLVAIITICHVEGASLFSWFWNKPSDETTVLVADGVPLISIPYETMTEDEKFLQEAAKLTDIQVSSPLETCQHKVVMRIRTSCSAMTEEELAKLSVNLLNCQSAVEGRKMFPCTEEMSLKQCTTDMDADMWNAYHLMSNRARAVCYAARSTQFRALTELTVNKLMQTAHSQIKALGSLKESQDRLEEQTVEALSSLSKGNEILLEQQQFLRDAQASAHRLVTTNLRDLQNEKALIRSGHTQLMSMTEDIKNKLEKASQELMEQSVERGENHKEVIEDLMHIQLQARLIWEKIESGTDRILEKHENAVKQYEQTLEKLAQINDTIQFISNLTNTMREEIDQKLGWITNYIGDTGEQLQRAYRITLHIVYLLFAMVVAAFLQAPFLTRVTIMGIVPLNLLSYLKHGMDACLDFPSITVLIFLITGMHFVMIGIQYVLGPKSIKAKSSEPVKVVNQNGYKNGDASKYMSSSYSNSVQKRLMTSPSKKIRELYNTLHQQLSNGIEKFKSLIPSSFSWRGSSLQQEELSCSYISAKKSHEDLLYDYSNDYANMSDDITDAETSRVMSERYDRFDDVDHLVDATDLRRRINTSSSNRTHYQYQPSSRSVSPSSRVLCSGITRSGRKCRLLAIVGQDFCSRHSTGTSMMGD